MSRKFSERLKELREERGLSQRQLALELGYSNKTIALWENNINIPSLENAKVIAVFFKVSIDYLAGLED